VDKSQRPHRDKSRGPENPEKLVAIRPGSLRPVFPATPKADRGDLRMPCAHAMGENQ